MMYFWSSGKMALELAEVRWLPVSHAAGVSCPGVPYVKRRQGFRRL